MALPSSIWRRGDRASQPAATAVAAGTIYYVTDEFVTERSNGTSWEDVSDTGSGVGGSTGSTDNVILRADGTGGSTVQGGGVVTLSDTGALGFPDNVRQTFNPGANAAGLNVGSVAGDPDTPSDGDIWYDSSANELTARINGSNVALGAGGSAYGYTYTSPSFSSVSALLHFDGSNGSTTITDQVGNTWTAAGTAAISTAESVFGGASLLVPGSGNSGISMTTNSGFNVGAGEWTIEFRWKYNGAPQSGARVIQTRNGDIHPAIGVNVDSSSVLTLFMSSTGSSFDVANGNSLMTLSQSNWNNVLIQKRLLSTVNGGTAVGAVVEAFLNGAITASIPIATTSLYYNAADTVIIGGQTTGTSRSMNAYMDEFRFTKGVALNKLQYEAPSAAFPNS